MGETISNIEVLIVGAGPAGLSAALSLGRLNVSTLVCHGGPTRNAQAWHMHNFLTHDGHSPDAFLYQGSKQLQAYPTVKVEEAWVEAITGQDNDFLADLGPKGAYRAKKILLCQGVKDRMPPIPGLEELWASGTGVYHCPYCHGWENRNRQLGILAQGNAALHLATLLVPLARELTLLTNGDPDLTEYELQLLRANGVSVREHGIARLRRHGTDGVTVEFQDPSTVDPLDLDGLFLRTLGAVAPSELGKGLRLAFTEDGILQTDEDGQTSVPGIYGAGDMAEGRMQQVIKACASGAQVAQSLAQTLLKERFESVWRQEEDENRQEKNENQEAVFTQPGHRAARALRSSSAATGLVK